MVSSPVRIEMVVRLSVDEIPLILISAGGDVELMGGATGDA